MSLFKRKSHKPVYSLISGELDEMPFIGHYDMALRKYRHKADYPYMLGISIQGFRVDERGLPTAEIRPAIDQFEDTITELVTQNADSMYCGHSFWNSTLEVILYLKEYEQIIKILEPEATKKGMLVFTFKIDHDPEWQQFMWLTDAQ